MKKIIKYTAMVYMTFCMLLLSTDINVVEAADIEMPSVPGNLTATAVSGSQIQLTWDASTDNVAVTRYDVYRYGSLLGSTTGTSYQDTLLSASTAYSYSVRAVDEANNVSGHSDTVSAITTPIPTTLAAKKGIGSSKYLASNMVQADFSKLMNVGAKWTYNWSIDYTGINSTSIEYVPQIWGPGAMTSSNLSVIESGKAEGRFKYLLTFNEPELWEQANMTVNDAISLWPTLMDIGLRLSSPAVALSEKTYAYGQTWLENFMDAASLNGYHVDFIAVHYYPDFMDPNAVDNLELSLTNLYEKYNKPIWITEIGTIDAGQLSSPPTVQGAQAFMEEVIPMLDRLSFIERYAWFDDNCSNDPACYYTTIYDSTDNLTSLGTTFQAAGEKDPLFRFGWTITSNPTSNDIPANMLDNNIFTRWSTAQAQVPGHYFVLDMQAVNSFSRIVMDSYGSNDYARGYEIYVSNDGINWGTSIASGVGNGSIISVDFQEQSARYVKVIQTGYAPANYWSIHELNLYN